MERHTPTQGETQMTTAFNTELTVALDAKNLAHTNAHEIRNAFADALEDAARQLRQADGWQDNFRVAFGRVNMATVSA
jgi:FtsZ-binding cell division protein ZapB